MINSADLQNFKAREMNKWGQRVLLFFMLALLLPLTAKSAAKKGDIVQNTSPELRLKWYQEHVSMKKTALFKNLNWQFIGPLNVSGRITDVEVVTPKGKNYTMYVAGASGGVWRTVNEGTTWEPIFQHAPSTDIGDVTPAPSNQEIIWVGTGEANIFRSSMAGAGVFKSTDAGKTWQHMGLTDTNTIARIAVHPTNPDIVYVAASGHEWTLNNERGVYKTTDGGKTWAKILFVSNKTGAIDLVMDPSAPDTLYASFWQRIRKKWNDPRNETDYKESGIYKTTDAGNTWTPINNGLPLPQHRGRIGIDLCRTKPNVVYAFVDNYKVVSTWDKEETDSYGRPKMGKIKGATVYRSDNAGLNWKQVSQDNDYMENLSSTYGWVFGQIKVDPVNENRIYVMGLGLNVSDDGGKTFRGLRGMHGDHHGLWIDPDNTDYLVNVNDGGIAVSYDCGKNFKTYYHNLPIVQFFNIMYDMAEPFHVYGSVQDHGSYRGIVDLSRGRNAVPAQKWEEAPGGEGSSHAIDPSNTDTVYSAGFYGNIERTNMKTWDSVSIVPKPAKGDAPYRGQWLAPFILSPHNPQVIYHGMNYLFRSMNRGETWERISPDLTYNDKNKIGDIQYQTLFSISESPLKFGLIYAGTDDGRVWVTRNSGDNWKEINKGLPYGKWISRLAASAFDLGTVYMTQNGKRDDDFAAYIWKSVDFGNTWMDISGNIPCGPVNVIREDPKNKNILYVGTDLGIYVTIDGGKIWHVLAGNFPTTFVHDLVIHPRDDIMVAATHGRGVYVLDVSHLQKIDGVVAAADLHPFAVADAKIPKQRWWGYAGGADAYFNFFLKQAAEVTIEIKNAAGAVIKQITHKADAGLNILAWDLKPNKPEAEIKDKPKSPFVEPGTYTATLTAGPHKAELKLTITN